MEVSMQRMHACGGLARSDLFSSLILSREEIGMVGVPRSMRRGILRAHHETWGRSDLNQRNIAHGLSLKAFGNWCAKFKSNPHHRGASCFIGMAGQVTP